MQTVKNVLKHKGRKVWSVGPNDTIDKALDVMAEHGIGAVLVLDDDKQILGIFSERDFARKARGATGMPVGEVMTKQVSCVGLDHTVDQCMNLMTNKHFRHLPVVEAGKLTGLISIGDIVRADLEAKGALIDQLEKYIVGAPA